MKPHNSVNLAPAREMLKRKQQDIKSSISGLVKLFGTEFPGGEEHSWIVSVTQTAR